MRKITMWFVATVVIVVLLFSYRTSTSGAGPGGTPPAAIAGAAPAAGADGAAGGSADTGSDQVVNGSVVQTRWGPVQVQVHITDRKITEVTALQIPNGNRRDVEINAYAVPQLRAEVLAAQSAKIDAVSGATVTSDGYVRSLQAALDKAHFTG
jgi:uncharacterized protein with FMN-binding domain